MADPEPTIRYTERAGKPVVEVGGTWTVFSVRGIRKKAEKALQAAVAGMQERAANCSMCLCVSRAKSEKLVLDL